MHRIVSLVLLLTILIGGEGVCSYAVASTQQGSSTLIVKLVTALTPAEQASAIARNGGVETRAVPVLRLHMVAVPDLDLPLVLQSYQSDPQVESVEVDKTRKADAVSSDADYGVQWSLAKIGWDKVFGAVTPSGNATVALLDTGVDGSHPDLAAAVVPGISILDGGNGLTDQNGHGTFLAGIVAAVTNNGIGIAGVAYQNVKVMPVSVLGADGKGQDSDIISGIVWAADHGADVILMGFSNPDYSQNLQDAIDYAWSKGAVLVAATGNDGVSTPTFPAGDRGVVGVSATDETDLLAFGSNHGLDTFLAAPGANIFTTSLGGTYTYISGTSASSAIIAGVAGFMRAADPGLSNGVVVGRLALSADAVGTPDDPENQWMFGNGRVNMNGAMASSSTDFMQPSGVEAEGGPYVGPYTAAVITPDVTSPTATSIGANEAVLGANVINDGNSDARMDLTGVGTVFGATMDPVENALDNGSLALGVFTQARTGFSAGSKYFYRGYATTKNGIGYSPSGSFYTEPATQASGVNFTSITATGMTVNWNRGSGSGVMVMVRSGSAVSAAPVDGRYGYAANPAFGGGEEVLPGNYAVYRGAGSSVTLTGLSAGTAYHVAVYEYAGSVDTIGVDQGTNYLQAAPATGNMVPQASQAIAVAIHAPAAAALHSQFGVAATADSGLEVSYSSGSPTVCTNSGATFTMISPSGTCLVQYDQAGDVTYSAAPRLVEAVTAIKADQAPLAVTGLPDSAAYFQPGITANWSGGTGTGDVTFSAGSSTACSVDPSSGAISISSGSGTCSITVSKAEDANYNSAAGTASIATIEKAALAVTANDRIKSYGQIVTFAGSEFTAGGLLGADAVTGVTLESAGAIALATVAGSPYLITPSAAVGTGLANYDITYISGTLTVTPASQTIAFDRPAETTYGATPFAISAAATSALPVSFATLTSSVCGVGPGEVSGATITIVASGTCTITAAQEGDSNYTAASLVQQSFTVNKAPLAVTASDRTKSYGESVVFAGSEFSAGGLVGADVVTRVTLESPGAPYLAAVAGSPYAITPSAAVGTGLANYDINYIPGTLTVTRAPQTIAFAKPDDTIYGFAPLTVSASATSSLPVSFASLTTSVCSVSAGEAGVATITGVGAGTCTITAAQEGDSDYEAATPVQHTFAVGKLALAVTANDRTKSYGESVAFSGTEFTAGALVGADAVTGVTLASPGAPPLADVAGSPYAITPSAALGTGLSNYDITYIDGTLTVNRASQTIAFGRPADTTYGAAPFAVSAEATSSLQVSFATLTPTVCSLSGGSINVLAAGTCTITAAQEGDSNYTAAALVQQSFTVNRAALTIRANDRTKSYGESVVFAGSEFSAGGLFGTDAVTSLTLTSTGASALATVAGSPYAITAGAASGIGLSNYDISYAAGTLTVTRAFQTITFNKPDDTSYSMAPFEVSAAATSALPVGFASLTPLICTVSGTTVQVLDVGVCIIQAAQEGNGDYHPADSVQQSFTVNAGGFDHFGFSTVPSPQTAGDAFTVTITAQDAGNHTVTSYNGVANLSSDAGTVTPATASFTEGGFTGAIAVTGAGSARTVTVTDQASGKYGTSNTFDVGAGPAVAFTVATAASAGAGSPFDVTVTAKDIHGNVASSYLGTIRFTTSDGHDGVGLPSEFSFSSYDGGSHTFPSSVVLLTAGVQTVTATDTLTASIAGTSGSIAVDAAGIAKMSVSAPATATAGDPFSVTVVVKDPYDNTITDYQGTLRLTSSDSRAILAGDYTFVPADLGRRIFSGIVLETAGSQTVSATDTATGSVTGTSGSIAVEPDAPQGLAVTQQPGSTGAGELIAPALTVRVVDRFNNLVVSSQAEVTVVISANPGGGTLAGTTTQTASGGVATFADLAIDRTGSGYTLAVSSEGVSAATSAPFEIVAGALESFAFSAVGNQTAESPFQITITAADAFGNAVPGFSGTVDLSISAGSSLSPAVSGDFSAGIWSGTVTVSGAGTGRTITAQRSGGTEQGTSDPMEIFMAGQTVTFAPLPDLTYGDAAFTVTATGGGSGNPVVFVAAPSSVCSAGGTNGATIAITAAGLCTVTATQEGNASYSAAAEVPQSFMVNRAPLSVLALDAAKSYGESVIFAGTEFTATGLIGADAVSAVTLTSPGAAPQAGVAGSPYQITPSAALGAGLSNYDITYISGTLTVQPASQTITFDDLADTSYGAAPFAVSAAATSSLPVSFASLTPAVCSAGPGEVSGATIAIAGAGLCTITAVQQGDSDYDAATPVQRSFMIAKIPLSVTADDRTKSYGESVVFAGTEFTAGGLVGSDVVSHVTLTSQGAAALAAVAGSPYAITPSAAVGTGMANYEITYSDGTLTVDRAAQTIIFARPADKSYGVAPFAANAAATSLLPVTLTSLTPSVCSLSGDSINILAAGLCTVTATQGGDSNFMAAAEVQQTFMVNKALLAVTASDLTKSYGEEISFAGTEFSASGLVGSDAVTGVTLSSAGAAAAAGVAGSPYAITPSAALGTGLSNYTVTYIDGTLTVDRASQTVSFAKPADTSYGAAPFAVSAQATSSLPVSFVTLTEATCTVSAGGNSDAIITLAGAGLCTIKAVQPGDTNYAPADMQQSFTIAKASLSVTASDQSKDYGQSFTFAGTEFSAGGLFGLDVVTRVTLTSAGASSLAGAAGSPYAITPSGAIGTGLANYDITYSDGTLTVNQIPQTITFPKPSDKIYGVAPFAGNAAATSSLKVTLTSMTPYVCAINTGGTGGSLIAITGTGVCTITASQQGDANYTAAAEVQQSFTVIKADQATVKVSVPSTASFGAAGKFATGSGGNGTGAYLYSAGASTACSVDASTGSLTITSGSGTCSISALRFGDSNYHDSEPSAAATVLVTKADQSIRFTLEANMTSSDPPFPLIASSASGNPINFTVSGPATLDGNMLTITDTGTIVVRASVAGDDNYNDAPDVEQQILVTVKKLPDCAPVSNLMVPAASSGSINVSWAQSGTIGVTYILEQSYQGGAWSVAYSGANNAVVLSVTATGSYAYQVKAVKADHAESAYATSASVCIVSLGAPGSLTFPATSTGSISVKWAGSSTAGATYVLERSVDGGDWSRVYSGSNTAANVTATAAGSYSFRVKTEKSGFTDSAYATSATACVVSIGDPSGLVVPAASTGSILVRWTGSSTPGVTYILERSFNGAEWSQVYSNTNTATYVTVTAMGSYAFRLKAVKADFADSAYATSSTVCLVSIGDPSKLAVPSTSTGSILVRWTGSSTAGVTYILERSFNGGEWSQVYSGTSYLVYVNAAAMGNYEFRVKASRVGFSDSAYATSATVCTVSLGAPSGLLLPAASTGSISVRWSGSSTAGAAYVLEQSFNGGEWIQVYSGPNKLAYVTAAASGSYAFRVKATKTNFADSDYAIGANDCAVTK